MNGKPILYRDQYGHTFFARTVKELRGKIGNGQSRVSKMYSELYGDAKHIGYVIGTHWLRACEAVDFGPVAPSR